MRKVLLVLALLTLSACSNEQADLSMSSKVASEEVQSEKMQSEKMQSEETTNSKFYGDLSTEGTDVVDKEGNVVQLKGISTHGINWFPDYVNYDLMSEFNEQTDINTFRVAMYTEDYNGYLNTDSASQQQLLDLIDQAVEYAVDLDMYVIIDWHILNDNNPLNHTQEAIQFFELMSSKYGDLDNVIFEICNEPNGDTTWADIEQYANKVIPVIRENSDNLVIVGTPTWSQDVDQVEPLDFNNVVYTLHFYAATHKDDLRAKAQTAIDNGIPLFVSEFGISDASGNGGIDTDEADKWINFLDENQISYVMWNLSNKDESSALIKSSVTKTNGFTSEDLTDSGNWYLQHVGKNQPKKEVSPTKSEDTPVTSEESKDDVSFNVVSTWDGGGQYEAVINNSSNSPLSDWKIKLVFNNSFELEDSWNGKFTQNGNTITITPEDYNKQVEANGTVEDIGFTVKADQELDLKTIQLV